MDKFKQVGNSVVFLGNTLEIFVPVSYQKHGVYDAGDEITVLGVFDMTVDGKEEGYYLPAKIVIQPSKVETVSVDDNRFFKLTLFQDDVFIKNTEIVRDEYLAYIIFYEFVCGGNTPNFIKYDDTGFIFDVVSEVTGISFPTDHSVFEMIAAELHRDPDNVSKQWRRTDLKKEPLNIPMRLVSHAAISTTSKIIGSYMDAGIDASLVNASDVPSDIEDLLRQ
jgi:hypothetical protein